MSDERLRELERRWRETRAVQDEAALLAERVRVGDLSHERLSLAANVGHPAAAVALGGTPNSASADPVELVEDLDQWSRPAAVRACVGAAAAITPWWERDNPGDGSLAAALDAVRAWTDCPCPSHAQEAWRLAGEIPTHVEHAGRWSERAAEATWGAVRATTWAPPPPEIDQAPGLADAVVLAQEVLADDDGLRQRLVGEVVRWALGAGHAPSTG